MKREACYLLTRVLCPKGQSRKVVLDSGPGLILSTFLLIQWNHPTHRESGSLFPCSAQQIQTLSSGLFMTTVNVLHFLEHLQFWSMPHPCMRLTVWSALRPHWLTLPWATTCLLFLLWTEGGGSSHRHGWFLRT